MRVSGDEQRERETIELQREFLDGYCQLNGLEVAGSYADDGVSGTIPLHDRPAGRRLLADAKAGRFGIVLCYKLDRMGRSLLSVVETHERLHKAGVALKSATEVWDTSTPQGRMIFHQLAAFAEYERELIRERTRAGLHRAYKNGTHTGRIPYGFDIDEQSRFVVVPEEAAVVRQIIANIASGATLYSESKRLNNEGIPSPGYRFRDGEGRKGTCSWSPSTVRGLVYQTAYSGVHRVHVEGEDGQEEIIERPVPAIVELGLRERAEAQLIKNKSRAGELRENGRKYLLSGLVRCGICGLGCAGRTSTARTSGGMKKYSYYACNSNRAECRNRADAGRILPHRAPSIAAEWLEELVWRDVRAFLANPGEVLERVREREADQGDYGELEERRDSLKKRLVDVERELDRLVSLYASGEMDAERLTTHVRDREERIEHLRLMISAVESDIASHEQNRLAAKQAETWLRTLADNLAEVEADTPEAFGKRRELVRLLVEKVTADRDEDGHARVEITYRFGPPPDEGIVTSVQNTCGNFAAKRKPSGEISRHLSTVERRGVP
jgi:site-specific DNA recombinase